MKKIIYIGIFASLCCVLFLFREFVYNYLAFYIAFDKEPLSKFHGPVSLINGLKQGKRIKRHEGEENINGSFLQNEVFNYVNGKLEGPQVIYVNGDLILASGFMINGKEEGEWVFKEVQSTKSIVYGDAYDIFYINYKQGIKNGVYIRSFYKNELENVNLSSGIYLNGDRIGQWSLFEDNNSFSELNFKKVDYKRFKKLFDNENYFTTLSFGNFLNGKRNGLRYFYCINPEDGVYVFKATIINNDVTTLKFVKSVNGKERKEILNYTSIIQFMRTLRFNPLD